MARKDPDKYLGRWQESSFERLTLPLTTDSLRELVEAAAEASPAFTHQQIAHWCATFWWTVEEGQIGGEQEPSLSAAAEIALDIEAQWDLYVVDRFSLKELQEMDFGLVRLPIEWFNDWRVELARV